MIQQIKLDPEVYDRYEPLLDDKFKPNGEIIPVAASIIKYIDPVMLRYYLHQNGIYALITNELVQWFKDNVDLSNAIEIGSGVGTLGKALGIRCTDSFLQTEPEIKAYYEALGQPTIKYGIHVEKIEGLAAIKRFKPSVVIGSWITHKWNDSLQNGNDYAPDELEIMKNTDTYYLVGNLEAHQHNRLFNEENIIIKAHYFEGLYSRNQYKEENRIFEFRKK